MHGYFPNHPEMRATLVITGPHIAARGSLGEVDMRALAPTIPKLVGVELPNAAGTPLFQHQDGFRFSTSPAPSRLRKFRGACMSIRITKGAIALIAIVMGGGLSGCMRASQVGSKPIPFTAASVTSLDNQVFTVSWTAPYLGNQNERLRAIMKGRINLKLLEPLLGVRPAYLQAGFDAVDKTYGSRDRCVRDGLKLDDEAILALRSEFLAG
ncbi:MAG: alkaline phosphatase family protein [Rhodospirillales bacterium]|nr:alkaline phosphatase family protein [Rhodospirillales bacterium]